MGNPLSGSEYISRSRGRVHPYYYIITPENLVPNDLPFFTNTIVHPLVIPQPGKACFGEYLLIMNPGGQTTQPIEPGFEHFMFLIDGEVLLEMENTSRLVGTGGVVYLPDHLGFSLENQSQTQSRLLWIKKPYDRVKGLPEPEMICSKLEDIEQRETPVTGAWSYRLMPIDDPSYDFTILNLMFDPGVYFDQVEIHHQEHGLYMLNGQGVYYLADTYHEVKAGDFIYMAPFCPQYFYSTGWTPTSYLLYKDLHRDGFHNLRNGNKYVYE